MEVGRRLCSVTPHEDIENGFPRQPIPYHIVEPMNGIDDETGLLLFVDGFGGHPTDPYDQKLYPYLAERYNCVVVAVEYFDIGMKKPNLRDYRLSENFFTAFEQAYNTRLPDLSQYNDLQVLEMIAKLIANAKAPALHPSVMVRYQPKAFYQSFGLLPALDYLQVMIEVLAEYPLNKKRIFALGTSYGGYIACLMAKLAPNTFRLIVDNSGFTRVNQSDMVGAGYAYVSIFDCQMVVETVGLWSDDLATPYYLNHHHREIRNLLTTEHLKLSKTAYFCAHSVQDELVPVEEKQAFCALKEGAVTLDQVDDGIVDGLLYKSLKHGMETSLRRLMDKAYNAYVESRVEEGDDTDFDRGSEYDFPCSNGYNYHIKFSKDDVKLTLHSPT